MDRRVSSFQAILSAVALAALSVAAAGAQPSGEYEAALPNCKQIATASNMSTGLAGAFGTATNKIDWAMNPFERGREIEKALGADPLMSANFRAIDKFENGVATSIKSMDLNAGSYRDVDRGASAVKTRLKNYIDELKDWKGGNVDDGRIPPPGVKITKRVLKVGVRSCGASQLQKEVIDAAIKYADSVKVVIEFVAL